MCEEVNWNEEIGKFKQPELSQRKPPACPGQTRDERQRRSIHPFALEGIAWAEGQDSPQCQPGPKPGDMRQHIDVVFRAEAEEHQKQASAQDTAQDELARREAVPQQRQPLRSQQTERAHDHAGCAQAAMSFRVEEKPGQVSTYACQESSQQSDARPHSAHGEP